VYIVYRALNFKKGQSNREDREKKCQNFSSASWTLSSVKHLKRCRTWATLCSPWTLLSRVRIFTVLFCCSFSPTTEPNTQHPWANLKKVKFSYTRYWVFGPELIPVYRQSVRRWLSYTLRGRLRILSSKPAVTSVAFTRWCYMYSVSHPIPAYYSFIDPKRMKDWVGLVGWPVADRLPIIVVTHQLQVKHRTGKVRRPETDVLPLCHTTN